MNDQRSSPGWKDWLLAISPAIAVGGALLAGGGQIAQVKENTRGIETLSRRVDAFELKNGERDDKLNTIDVRTARIEAKLEVLLPSGRERGR